MKENIKRNLLWFVLFAVGLLCMWVTQRAVPIMMDDEWYGTLLFDTAPLSSLQDIMKAQIWHYQNWGGRTVAHTIVQLIFLYMNEPMADALNIVMIVLLAWMINVTAEEKRFAFLTLTIGFLHGLNANWKMSMYWQTGACNYLYTSVIIMAFLWLYLRMVSEKETKEIHGLILIAPVLGLLAGWTNENMGPTVWILTVLVMLTLKREKRHIKLWMPLGSIFCLLGSVLMILAPGNAVRSASVVKGEYGAGAVWQLFLRMYRLSKGMWEYLFPAMLVAAALLFVNVCVLNKRIGKRDGCLLLGVLLSWGAMILSPHYPDRASFGTLCLLLCLICSQASMILKTVPAKKCRIFMSAVGIFIWLHGMYLLGEFLSIGWGWIR